jgi:hypothetical protein
MPLLTTTVPKLAGRSTAALVTFGLSLPKNAWTETEYRYDICWAALGALTELNAK